MGRRPDGLDGAGKSSSLFPCSVEIYVTGFAASPATCIRIADLRQPEISSVS
jgi:hypothetical protein